jgi:hypothetical protein
MSRSTFNDTCPFEKGTHATTISLLKGQFYYTETTNKRQKDIKRRSTFHLFAQIFLFIVAGTMRWLCVYTMARTGTFLLEFDTPILKPNLLQTKRTSGTIASSTHFHLLLRQSEASSNFNAT